MVMSAAERAPTADLAISASAIEFSYGRLVALQGLELQVPSGTAFGLLGPNGSGKTTFIKMLVGLLRPRRGLLRVLGGAPSPRTALSIGYMPQTHALYEELTVWENVEFFARVYGIQSERRQRVQEVLALVGMEGRARSQVFTLSGGMKQRVSLACALVHRPPLLLLDEPTVGLDPELRATFWRHFEEMTRQGVTLLISSHTMDDAAHCHRLAFLRDGRVIAQGSPAELRAATGQADASLEEAFLHFARSGGANYVP